MAESGKALEALNERLCPTLPFKKFLKEFLKKDNPYKNSVTQQEQNCIDAANSIRTEFLSHHVKLVRKFAKKYTHNHLDFDKLEDLKSEIMLAMIYASYCYKHSHIKFTTFSWLVINNWMGDYFRSNSGFSPIPKENCQLANKVWDYIASQSHKVTFDEACQILGLDYEQAKEALLARKTLSSFTDFKSSKDDDKTWHEIEPVVYDPAIIDPIYLEAIENAGLNELEKITFDAYVESLRVSDKNPREIIPEHGWATDLANKLINPKTNKPYSSQGIVNQLPKAKEKIKAVFSRKVA